MREFVVELYLSRMDARTIGTDAEHASHAAEQLTREVPGDDGAYAVALQPDGKTIVAGYAGANTALTATRLNGDGSLDTAFGDAGVSGADLLGLDTGRAVALQPADGKIVVAGDTIANADSDIAVARFNADGSIDETFDPGGTDGAGKKKFGYAGDDHANAVLLTTSRSRV
jgi:uncharacterized delta-60 repeat protein